MRKVIGTLCLLVASIGASPAAQLDTSILIRLEGPSDGGTASGIGTIRGWAVAPSAISRIELYVDGVKKFDVPYGGSRTDVGRAYPTYPNSALSGFGMATNFSTWTAGVHTIEALAIDVNGNFNSAISTVAVVKFDNSYMSNPASVNLTHMTAVAVSDTNSLRLDNVLVEGIAYSVTLKWTVGTQGMEIIGLEKW
jgi:hypothetical protein